MVAGPHYRPNHDSPRPLYLYVHIYLYPSPPPPLSWLPPLFLRRGREASYSRMALRVPVFVYTDGELDLGSDINGVFIHSIVDAPSGA
ncbi:hypothetical protein AVEN_54119-1 [Araneus ventricosus]|uniref:Uncharacterized protein n=1 Tax=Araneus ventricosus TaxID=182803 RepID=A0A4Y2BVM6_ARAVE|nr:hypothetical protein AVEN_54119-1 [Araneus ventricosus]